MDTRFPSGHMEHSAGCCSWYCTGHAGARRHMDVRNEPKQHEQRNRDLVHRGCGLWEKSHSIKKESWIWNLTTKTGFPRECCFRSSRERCCQLTDLADTHPGGVLPVQAAEALQLSLVKLWDYHQTTNSHSLWHPLMLHHRGSQKWRAECLNPWLFPYIWYMVELYGVYESLAVRGHYLPCSALRLIEGHIRKCISIYHILVDRYAFLVLARLL